MDAEDITVSDCDYHSASGWCTLSENECFVSMLDGNECDEFNELKNEWVAELT